MLHEAKWNNIKVLINGFERVRQWFKRSHNKDKGQLCIDGLWGIEIGWDRISLHNSPNHYCAIEDWILFLALVLLLLVLGSQNDHIYSIWVGPWHC